MNGSPKPTCLSSANPGPLTRGVGRESKSSPVAVTAADEDIRAKDVLVLIVVVFAAGGGGGGDGGGSGDGDCGDFVLAADSNGALSLEAEAVTT